MVAVGLGARSKLSAYDSRYDADAVRYLDGAGNERRDNLDVRYQIARGPVDWDLEVMRQTGRVGGEQQVGDAIRRAGGLNANYVSLELRFGW